MVLEYHWGPRVVALRKIQIWMLAKSNGSMAALRSIST